MEKKYKDVETENALQNYYLCSLMPLTKTYKQFKSSWFSQINFKSIRLKGYRLKAMGGPFFKAWPLFDLLRRFFNTHKGKHVAGQLKFIKCGISVDRTLLTVNYLSIALDLTCSKQQLRREFEYILNKYYPQIKRPLPKRTYNVMKFDETNEAIRFYKLVRKHKGNLQRAMWEMLPETAGKQPAYDEKVNSQYQKLSRLYHKIERDIKGIDFPSPRQVISKSLPTL